LGLDQQQELDSTEDTRDQVLEVLYFTYLRPYPVSQLKYKLSIRTKPKYSIK